MQLREERLPHESRLISELRHMQTRHMRPTASHRLDGYTSDTTAFADDDEDFSIPLHINTSSKSPVISPASPPSRSSSRNYSTKAMYSNERPFVAVKRAHEQNYSQVSRLNPSTKPVSLLHS